VPERTARIVTIAFSLLMVAFVSFAENAGKLS
jgi:hypothetical protein